jgi:hypothetical protein
LFPFSSSVSYLLPCSSFSPFALHCSLPLLKQVGFFFGFEPTTSLLLLVAIDQSDVTFCLFTAPNKNCIPIDYRNGSRYLDKDAEVVILIHGWNTNATTQWYKNVTDAFLTRHHKKYNIIQVDYTKVSTENYLSAVRNVPEVGKSRFLKALQFLSDHALSRLNRGLCRKSDQGRGPFKRCTPRGTLPRWSNRRICRAVR